MLNVDEIKNAIELLPEKDFIQLRQWFSEKNWTKWDRQIEDDGAAVKLDFLVKEALDEKRERKLKDL
jgi:hypothetical protein